jgi:hypothetical protein
MPKFNFNRKLSAGTKAEPITDELYDRLSLGNQVLTNIGEDLKIQVLVADYNGNKYLSRETILAIAEALQK